MTSFIWKGRPSDSRSRLNNSVISSAELGFLILFNAREMCSSEATRIRNLSHLQFQLLKNEPSLCLTRPCCQHGSEENVNRNMANHAFLAGSSLTNQVSYRRGLMLSGTANLMGRPRLFSAIPSLRARTLALQQVKRPASRAARLRRSVTVELTKAIRSAPPRDDNIRYPRAGLRVTSFGHWGNSMPRR